MASKSLKLMTVLIASEADIAVSDFRGWGHSRHPNVAAGLPLVTQSGHPASIDSFTAHA